MNKIGNTFNLIWPFSHSFIFLRLIELNIFGCSIEDGSRIVIVVLFRKSFIQIGLVLHGLQELEKVFYNYLINIDLKKISKSWVFIKKKNIEHLSPWLPASSFFRLKNLNKSLIFFFYSRNCHGGDFDKMLPI